MSIRISHIQIRGEGSSKTYVAGSILDGHIQFTVLNPCKIYTCTVGLYGIGKSKWEIETDKKKHRVKGYEEYNTVCDLIRDGETILYPEGKYDIPFRLKVNPNTPQSYDGTYSKIKYVLRAKLKTGEDSELITIKHEHKVRIRIIRDLNQMLDKRRYPLGGRKVSIEEAFKEELGCWFSTLGKIVYQIYCLRQAFVRGDEIELKIVVLNHTTSLSCFLHYALQQRTMNIHDNRALERSMAVVKSVAYMDGEMLLPSQETEKTIVFKLSKHIPISGCRDCNIVDISYHIKVQFELFSETSGIKSTKRNVFIPIIIGDIPLDTSQWKHLQNQTEWASPKKFFMGMRTTWDCNELVRAKRFNREKFSKTFRRLRSNRKL